MPAIKSVTDGIDYVQSLVIHTLETNININRENQMYTWKKNKDGLILDEPNKVFDHGMDAKRYALWTEHVASGSIGGVEEW